MSSVEKEILKDNIADHVTRDRLLLIDDLEKEEMSFNAAKERYKQASLALEVADAKTTDDTKRLRLGLVDVDIPAEKVKVIFYSGYLYFYADLHDVEYLVAYRKATDKDKESFRESEYFESQKARINAA